MGIDFFPYHVILKIKRGAAGRRESLASYKEVTVKWLNLWRLLLFIVVNMDEQSQNAHDELTDQDQFRMSHHMYHLPPRKRRLYKRSLASSRRRGLPPTEYWQRQRISMRRGYYSTFCRIWQDKRAAPKGGNPSVTGCARATSLSQGRLLVQDISPPCERGDTAKGGGGIPSPAPLASPLEGGAPAGGGEGFPGKKEIPRRGIGD